MQPKPKPLPEPETMNIYQEHGHKDRKAYLYDLAAAYNVEFIAVLELADILGPEEDFDGLIVNLQDWEELGEK